jgi:hypothetical protein
MLGEGLAEFLADGLVVRSEDDEGIIGTARIGGGGVAAEGERQRDDEGEQSENDGRASFHREC